MLSSDREGYARLRKAADIGAQLGNDAVLYCLLCGRDPEHPHTDLGAVMEYELRKIAGSNAAIIRPPTPFDGVREVCDYMLKLTIALPDDVVFVVSAWQLPRVRLTCMELLGIREYMRRMYTRRLRFEQVDTGRFPRDKFLEPGRFARELGTVICDRLSRATGRHRKAA
jgi:hypothetical protein